MKTYKEYIRKVASITKNSLKLTKEIMDSDYTKYKATYKDYYNFKFYDLTDEQKKTFLTSGYNNKLIKKYNNKDYVHIFKDKEEFYTLFNKYLGRKWLINKKMTYIEFVRLVILKKYLIYKPVDKTQGQGVIKIKVTYPLYSLYKKIRNMEYGIIEQFIIQINSLNEFSSSVNTIRINTINDNGCNIIYAGLRLGDGLVVDNFHAGGMIATINVDTGVIVTRAINMDRIKYKFHPTSKKQIKGFTIPYWKEVKELINNVYNIVPEVGYVAWDVAITKKGPIIVEGNATKPGYTVIQLPYVDNKIGMKYKVSKFINSKKSTNK